MFRVLPLPLGVPGRVFLHSMPGRNEPLSDAIAAIQANGVDRVISLAPLADIQEDSPAYAALIAQGTPDWQQEIFPIEDFRIPTDLEAYLAFFERMAGSLRAGETLLLHCAAGIGRTGMGAVTLLLLLGIPLDTAQATVRAAGSRAEAPEQHAFLQRVAARIEGSAGAS
jgi:atypical dual specificity phosphatase